MIGNFIPEISSHISWLYLIKVYRSRARCDDKACGARSIFSNFVSLCPFTSLKTTLLGIERHNAPKFLSVLFMYSPYFMSLNPRGLGVYYKRMNSSISRPINLSINQSITGPISLKYVSIPYQRSKWKLMLAVKDLSV